MSTIKQVTVFSFAELSEQAQQKALEAYAYINVEFDWWESVYEDAENLGCKISSFDIGRGSDIGFECVDGCLEVATKILGEHGENCETYKIAKRFIDERDALVEKHSDGIRLDIVSEENESDFDDECDDLETEFCEELGNEYLAMLRREYEYLTSKEAIEEWIEANEVEFLESGKTFRA